MSQEIYGNETYPTSRRIHSRPHDNWGGEPTGSEENDQLDKFKQALFELGDTLIGSPFEYCCDVDRFPTPSFLPTFWHEDAITAFQGTAGYIKYRQSLPAGSGQALDKIVTQVVDKRNSKERRGDYITFSRPYGVPELQRAFKDLWQDDIFIDARLYHTEKLFFCAANDIHRMSFGYHETSRLEATLEWMAEPENARRLALMFLYSRLAQHYGERDPRSFMIATSVAGQIGAACEKNVIQTLSYHPLSYIAPASVVGQVREGIARLFPSASSRMLKPEVQNPAGLRQSASAMVADYKRLCDGSWAKQQIGQLRMEENLHRRSPEARIDGLHHA